MSAAKALFIPAIVNFEMSHADTFHLYCTFVDSTGATYDFTGASAAMRVIKKSDNTTVQDFDSSGNGITFPAAGVIEVLELDTTLWPVDCDLMYDLQVVLLTGYRRTFLKGTGILNLTITPPE